MSWSCRRPGCGRNASVFISYDSVARQVWMDAPPSAPPSAQPLCDEHAERMTPPRGWIVLDHRKNQTRLASQRTGSASTMALPSEIKPGLRARARRKRLERRWGEFEAPQFEFLTTPAGTQQPEARVSDPVPAQPVVVETEPDIETELDIGGQAPAGVAHQGPRPWSGSPRLGATLAAEPAIDLSYDTSVPEPEPKGVVSRRAVAPEPVVAEVVAPESIVAEVVAPEPVVPEAVAPELVDTEAESDDELLRPKGGLLARAFDATGEQRSVLTAPLGRGDASDAGDSTGEASAEDAG